VISCFPPFLMGRVYAAAAYPFAGLLVASIGLRRRKTDQSSLALEDPIKASIHSIRRNKEVA